MLRFGQDEPTAAIKQVLADVEYEVHVEVAPFELRQYRDAVSGQHITDSAVAELDVGAASGSLVIAYKDGEGGDISFVRDSEGPTSGST